MRLYKYLVLIVLFITSPQLLSQSIGQWNIYPSVNSISGIHADTEGTLWISTTGGVVTFDEQVIINQYTPLDGLSRLDGRTSILSQQSNRLFIGYIDGGIDVLDTRTGSVSTINDIKRNQNFTEKAINKFLTDGDTLFVATDFGIVLYDIRDNFIIDTYTKLGGLGRAIRVNDIALYRDTLLAATEDGIAYASLMDALILPGSWISENAIAEINEEVPAVAINGDNWYATVGSNTYRKTPSGWISDTVFGEGVVDFKSTDTGLFAFSNNSIVLEKNDGTTESLFLSQGVNAIEQLDDSLIIGTANNFIAITDTDLKDIHFKTAGGPYQNFFKGISFDDGVLISGSTNQSARNSLIDRAKGYYIYRNESWANFNQFTNDVLRNFRFQQSFNSTVTDQYYYFGAWGRGVVRHRKSDNEIRVFDETNSIIRGWQDDNPLFPVISGIGADRNDNAWIVSRYGSNPLYVQLNNTDEWISFPKIAVSSRDEYESLYVDSNGLKWIPLETSTGAGTGLLVVDTGSPEDSSDDRGVKLTDDQNNGNLPDNKVNTILEDKNGEVWIGTQRGIARFLFPSFIVESTNSSDRRAQWLINEDTEALSRFLLRDINVSAMAVNAANEKWIGSANQGIWVLNEEGSRIINRFTSDNSALISNSIISIAVNDQTGEVFIATDLGLMSYQDTPLRPVNEMGTLKVFPNPFVYDQHNRIVVEGLSESTRINVIAADGTVVNELETRGGRIEWDARGFNNELLSSGVYFLMALDGNGGSKGTGKVIIIR